MTRSRSAERGAPRAVPQGNGRSADGPVDGPIHHADAVVVGSGVAGLSAALALRGLRTLVLTKGPFGAAGSTHLAQGGVAAALAEGDSPELHARDTLEASAGLAHRSRVDLLAREGPARIRELLRLGARFDELPDGRPARGREAMHSAGRVLHAGGDRTGREILRVLRESVQGLEDVAVEEGAQAFELLVEGGRVRGIRAVDGRRERLTVRAPAVVLASGGIGRLYLHTTNPPDATGDGVAMAARAGAALADLEFVQFHPTALAAEDTDPLPLVSEAVRGEGALLVDGNGRRVMEDRHPAMELAPRDVVARVIGAEREAGRTVYLDARERPGGRFPERFPGIFRRCRDAGIDPRKELIPVAPAEHFHMGGVATDDRGRTSLPGLWACGEVAATGVHGANRLASNSLLEGLVFGSRAGRDAGSAVASSTSPAPAALHPGTLPAPAPEWEGNARDGDDGRARNGKDGERRTAGDGGTEARLRRLRLAMEEHVGLVRHEKGLLEAMRVAGKLAGGPWGPISRESAAPAAGERRVADLALVGYLVAAAALLREESRGAHRRLDHPETRTAWARRSVVEAPRDLRAGARRGRHEEERARPTG